MKKCKYLIAILTLMITLCSCGTKENSTDYYTKIFEKYKNMKSYRCKVELTVTSNKTTSFYTMKHCYLEPDKYRVELEAPDGMKGLTTIYNGPDIITVAPDIQKKFEITDYNAQTKDYLFLPNFFENYYKSEQTSVMVDNHDEGEYTVLRADIPGNNIYRCSQAVWFDNLTLLPVKTEIYDLKNEPVIIARFSEFEMNIKLQDEIFKIN